MPLSSRSAAASHHGGDEVYLLSTGTGPSILWCDVSCRGDWISETSICSRSAIRLKIRDVCVSEWGSEQFLSGISADKRPFRADEVIMEVTIKINNQ